MYSKDWSLFKNLDQWWSEDFVVKHFGEYFKSTKEKLYSKFCEEQNIGKVGELLYFFLTAPNDVEKSAKMIFIIVYPLYFEILNIFDPELQLINTKPMIKNKLKELLSELKKFKVQTRLVLEYKKRNNRKIFHSRTKLIASDSDIDETSKYMQQSIITKIKNCKTSYYNFWLCIEKWR